MRLVELQQGEDLEVLLRRLHLVEELPMREIGARLGISALAAGAWVRRFGLDLRTMARKQAQAEAAAAARKEVA